LVVEDLMHFQDILLRDLFKNSEKTGQKQVGRVRHKTTRGFSILDSEAMSYRVSDYYNLFCRKVMTFPHFLED